jgi:hypothetical protein
MRSLGNLTTLGTISLKRQGRIKTSKETWCEAEVNRIAGKIALKSPQPDVAKAEGYFERALSLFARQQQAKSWKSAPP